MKPFSLNIKGKLHIFTRPLVMGVLNVTPDSFYSNSRNFDKNSIEKRVRQLVEEKADIIDIGAYSTRPGASPVTTQEELCRLERGMDIIRKIAPEQIVSVDTFRADVAEKAVNEFDCDIINDIGSLNFDNEMLKTVSRLNVPYILTHNRGTVPPMQSGSIYMNLVTETISELSEKIACLTERKVKDIIIDPGIGFSKNTIQNYSIIQHLNDFEILNRPILVGLSRKSLLTNLLSIDTKAALSATTAVNAFCLDKCAAILRVHDVSEARESIQLYCAINNIAYP